MARRRSSPDRIDVVAAREQVVEGTVVQLGRAALLYDSIRGRFAYTHLRHDTLLRSLDPRVVRAQMFTTPRIVLPAQPLATLSAPDKPVFSRRSVANITFEYDYPESTQRGIRDTLPDGPTPTPSRVLIAYPHPVALLSEQYRPDAEKYRYSDNVTVSGTRLDMYPWSADILAASLPSTEFLSRDRDVDELRDFGVFRDYPEEALVARPESVDFHRRQLERFASSLGLVEAALDDPRLNPVA